MNGLTEDSEKSLISGIDFRAFIETLRLRWWIVPVVLVVSVGLLWAQESDLQTEPESYFLSRTYEARDPTALLASVGIDPISVRAFPDINNQLVILQSTVTRDRIAKETGNDAIVNVSRAQPSFTLVDTLESDGKSSFVFQSAGVPTYSFNCTNQSREKCDSAIDAYVREANELRSASLRLGFEDLQAILKSLSAADDNREITMKLNALDALKERVETPMFEISRYDQSMGSTVTNVKRPTYLFGVTAGIFVSLVILLQLTYSDNRIRSLRQLTRLTPRTVIGALRPSSNGVGERRVAVKIGCSLSECQASRVRLMPIREPISDLSAVNRAIAMLGVESRVTNPFSDLAVNDIAQPTDGEIDILIVQRNRDRRADVLEVLATLASSHRNFAGILLVG